MDNFFRLSGTYDCLVPVTKWCGVVFKYIIENGKPPPKVRAAEMWHILLVLPFLLHDLLRLEVEAHNRKNDQADHVVDPSAEVIGVVNTLLTWYRLFRRRSRAKDEEDLKRLTALSKRSPACRMWGLRGRSTGRQ
jgi:hypothetical protein